MIYLMRHGQTVWNQERRAQGRQNSPLTALGEAQARAYAARLRPELGELADLRLISSPLGRARQTAEIVAEGIGLRAERIELDERLAEYSFGAWEGLTLDTVRQDHAEDWRRYRADRWSTRVPGGECYADVAERLTPLLATLGEEQRVVLVGHGAAGRILRGLYASLPQADMLALSEPQDRIFRLTQGRIEELLVAPETGQ